MLRRPQNLRECGDFGVCRGCEDCGPVSYTHLVIFAENGAKSRHCLMSYKQKTEHKYGNYYYKGCGKRSSHNKGHDYGENKHQRRAYRCAYQHHVRHLYICDIGCHSCHERRGREPVDILKGKFLYSGKNIRTYILGKTR